MALFCKPNSSNPRGTTLANFAGVALLAASLLGCGGAQNPKTITIPIPRGIPTNSQEVQEAAEVAQPWIKEAKKAAGPAIKEAEQAAKQGLQAAQRESEKQKQITCKAELPERTELDRGTPAILGFKIYNLNIYTLKGVYLQITQNTDHANRSGWVFTLPNTDNRFLLSDSKNLPINLTSNGNPLETIPSPNGQTIRFFDANGKDAGVATLTCSKPAQIIPQGVSNFLGGNGGHGGR